MKPTRMRLTRVAAALSTIAIAAVMSTVRAGTAAADPGAGQGTAVSGPTYITTAPSTIINTNIQVSDGDISMGDQTAS
ncbi:hypothetical protein [Candidatus Solirubrobacter pratensis]|uniref:hypothetical protein n=1 Tax=Candidatus Solirubrobacter pratensis TaxID=1298857 RepID=UPI0012DED887|nr:hypothetical protein [Candidatus Solirubrobacter pratensis]